MVSDRAAAGSVVPGPGSGSRDPPLWFSQQSIPTFALAGRRRGIEIASTGPDKVPALRTAVRRLVELGHKRIVRWADNVASGKDDRTRSFNKAAFIEGGTIGPVASRDTRIG
jgi:DNA-binding LacI/PurR family transcriptional regulator